MANYTMRSDGTAANKAAAEDGDPSVISECMSISTHNGETFSAGDVIMLADNGGDYRDQLNPPSSGTSGLPITYQAYSGDAPIIKASDIITGWTVYSGSIYQATVSVEPEQIWYDETFGNRTTGTGSMSSEGDWYWASSTLYLYASGDPDTQYTTPGVEAGQRQRCIYVGNKNYVTVDGLTVAHSNLQGLFGYNSTGSTFKNCTGEWCWTQPFVFGGSLSYSDCTIEDCICRYSGVSGILLTCQSPATISDCAVRRNDVYENGRHQGKDFDSFHQFTSGIKVYSPNTQVTNVVVEHNKVYTNGLVAQENGTARGNGIWFDMTAGSPSDPNLVRYNLSHDNEACAIFLEVAEHVHVYGNVGWDNANDTGTSFYASSSVRLDSRNSYRDDCNDNRIYNNTFVGGKYGFFAGSLEDTATVTDNIVKNNIFVGCTSANLRCMRGGDNVGVRGSGNIYQNNCFGSEGTNFIEWTEVGYSTYDAWEAASGVILADTDTNSIEDDPDFFDDANDKYWLATGSPCIGAGVEL